MQLTVNKSEIDLGRIVVPKACNVLADGLRKRIRSGALGEGQVLPSERDLIAQTGLSRASVREALRILEVEGLIETRPGRNGGSRVRRPEGGEFFRHLDLFIWGRRVSFEDLHTVREALEAVAAELSARHRDEADLRQLEAKTAAVEAAIGDVGAYLAANLEWHMAVARASRNDLLIGFMDVLSNAILEATNDKAFNLSEVRQATVKAHRAILEAIARRDGPAARRRMARHVAAAREIAMSSVTELGRSKA